MSDGQGFDPRYNPEFQRGYEPRSRDQIDERLEQAQPARDRVRAPRERPGAQRVAPMPVAPAPEPAISRSEAIDPLDSMEALFSHEPNEEDQPAEVPPWRNPYLIALTAIGVVLTIAGLSIFRWAVSQMYSGQVMGGTGADDAQQDWIWVQVAWGMAPLLTISGVLTVIGVIFFLAVKWKPRKSDIDDTDDEQDG